MTTVRTFLNTSHQTVGWFAQHNELGLLELRPPFQRRPVWTDDLKSFLVDTVLRGYPVPEVYTFEMPSDNGGSVVAVVDGQQRIRALLEYLGDSFPIEFPEQKLQPIHSLDDTPWMHKRYSELSIDEQKSFRNYKLIVRDLESIEEREIRHLFHRLNQSNLALNAQELRYSIYDGGLLACAEQLTKRLEWGQLGVFTSAQRRRMLDTEFISELVVGFLHWPQNKKDNLDHYYRQYAKVLPSRSSVEQTFDRTLWLMRELFPKPKMAGTRWYRRSDFYTLFLALARGRVRASAVDDLRRRLTLFSSLVSGAEDSGDPVVEAYRAAVIRAASDRNRRVQRDDSLVQFLDRGIDSTARSALDLAPPLDTEEVALGEEALSADVEEPDDEDSAETI